MNSSAVFYRTHDTRDRAIALAAKLSVPAFDGSPLGGRRQKDRVRFYRDRLGEASNLILEFSAAGLEARLLEEDQLLRYEPILSDLR